MEPHVGTGVKLKRAREALQPVVSQYDVAQLLQIKRSRYAAWEIERNSPDPAAVRQLAQIWRLPLDWFYDGQDTPPPFEPEVARVDPLQAGPAAQGIWRGDKVLLRSWRGVLAGDGEEPYYAEEELPREVWAFLTGGDTENHDVLEVASDSMYDRIEQGDLVIVRRTVSPPPNTIVAVQSPGGSTYLKILRRNAQTGSLDLESANPKYRKILDVRGWVFQAVAVAIIGPPGAGRNIEWNEGRPLRA
jgi:transcriptional regulator with XRE-family HTH domain